jgi:endonuclease YncB( thermonuclease family)
LLGALPRRGGWAGVVVVLVLGIAAFPRSGREGAPASPETPPSRSDGWETFPNAHWEPRRNHDGDSFQVRAGGRSFELRLYFVDCPESYLSEEHPSQRQRVAEQARELGLTTEETVALGKAAKDRVAALLRTRTFTVHTKWERVYDGERFYGLVEFPDPERPGQPASLVEWLVRHGLARLHTKGTRTPDGRSAAEYETHLRSLESDARKRGVGAWRP